MCAGSPLGGERRRAVPARAAARVLVQLAVPGRRHLARRRARRLALARARSRSRACTATAGRCRARTGHLTRTTGMDTDTVLIPKYLIQKYTSTVIYTRNI